MTPPFRSCRFPTSRPDTLITYWPTKGQRSHTARCSKTFQGPCWRSSRRCLLAYRACTKRSTTKSCTKRKGRNRRSSVGRSRWEINTASKCSMTAFQVHCPGSWPTNWCSRKSGKAWEAGRACLSPVEHHLARN